MATFELGKTEFLSTYGRNKGHCAVICSLTHTVCPNGFQELSHDDLQFCLLAFPSSQDKNTDIALKSQCWRQRRPCSWSLTLDA